MQLAAVNQYAFSIRFIENPSEAVQLAAVKQNSEAINNIYKPSDKVKLAAKIKTKTLLLLIMKYFFGI